MDLTKLIPKQSRFHLSAAKKEFSLRPFNLGDEIWLKNTYGERVEEIFEIVDFEAISRIVFRQIEDRSFFKKQSVTFVNEEGDTEDIEVGGVELFRQLIKGWDEKISIMNAFIECVGFSKPDIKEEPKKKVTKKKRSKKKA